MSRRENAFAPLHQASVLGDAEHPRFDVLRLAQLIETLEHFHERLLRHFFGVFTLAAHEEAVLKHLGLERLDKTVEGFGLSGQERPREVCFGVMGRRHTSILSSRDALSPER